MATNIYRVHYCFSRNGISVSEEKVVDVVAANAQESTIKTVLANAGNGFARSGAVLTILCVQNAGPHGGDNGGQVVS